MRIAIQILLILTAAVIGAAIEATRLRSITLDATEMVVECTHKYAECVHTADQFADMVQEYSVRLSVCQGEQK